MPAAKEARQRPASREAMLKAFAKMKIDRVDIDPVEFTPTGILSLDIALHGGLPKSRSIVWFGNKGTGKSTTAMLITRELQRRGLRVAWFDAERTLEATYAGVLGVDLSMVDVFYPETLEQMWNMMMMALDSKAYALIVVDTLAKLSPSTELAADAGKISMGTNARVNSQSTRMWTAALDESPTTVLFLNQERVDLGAYGAPNIAPGGKAIGHDASLEIYMKSQGKVTYTNNIPDELIFNFAIKKTKVFHRPDPSFYNELRIACAMDKYEINYGFELFTGAKTMGLLLDKNGKPWSANVAYYGGENLGNGQKQVAEWFEKKSDLRDQIETEIIGRIQSGSYTVSAPAQPVQSDEAGDTGYEEQEPPPYTPEPGDIEA